MEDINGIIKVTMDKEFIDMGESFTGNRNLENLSRPIPVNLKIKKKEISFNFLKFFEYVLSNKKYSSFFENLEIFFKDIREGDVDDLSFNPLEAPNFLFNKRDLVSFIEKEGDIDKNFNIITYLRDNKKKILDYSKGNYSISSSGMNLLKLLDLEKVKQPNLRLLLRFYSFNS